MNKIRKLAALLLTLTMVLALAACGSKNGGSTEAEKSTKQENDNPYNLDYESTSMQPMSDKRASKETLAETANDYFQGLNIFTDTDIAKLTYKDVVEHIGVDPSVYQYEASNDRQIYYWFEKDEKGPWLSVYVNKDGTLYGSGSANLN